MRWLVASAKSLLILLIAGLLVFGSTYAANGIVTAIVCSSMGSTIILYQPESDTIVNKSNITITGRATQASTVNVSVDGIHRATINLTSLDQTFSVAVDMSVGTHEVKLTAVDICSVQNGTSSIVITYHPGAIPTHGPKVPTALPPTSNPTSASISSGAVLDSAPGLDPIADEDLTYGTRVIRGVIDNSQPAKPVDSTSAIVALPFIVGAGAFGWIHIRRIWHN